MKKITLFTTLAFCLTQSAWSASTVLSDSVSSVKEEKASVAPADTAASKPKKETEYEKLIKRGGSQRDGLFTVRHIEKSWYFEIPESELGRLLLCVTRLTSTPQDFKMYAGEEIQRNTVFFELRDEKTMFLRSYAQSYTAPKDSKIAGLVEGATVAPIIWKFDVVGRNPETRALLVDVTRLFDSDNKVGGFIQSDKSQVALGGLQADRTMIDTIRTYPINIEVATLRTYSATGTRSLAERAGFITLSLNTSIVRLPDTPMRPRFADQRVGYFQDKVYDYSDDAPTQERAIISRYRLVPKDKKAYRAGRLSEPEQPIVFYIDPATPKKWVPYLIKGVNDWNVAFEAAGFKNAIVAKEWPKNDAGMSVDDARFSMIRYLPSTTENAYGPRIVDPRSGEIIESHICWFHNVMQLVRKWYITQCGPLDKRAQTMNLPDDLMGELIRFVSSHEVGHALGLRHNMIASAATPVEKLRDKAWVEQHGHTASIMDYARFNYVAQPEDGIGTRGLFPRINDYDKWAIKWGYQWRPEFDDEFAEAKALRSEVTKTISGNKRLRYCGDEGKGQDPRSQSEDLGDNSMRATAYAIKNLKRVVENLEVWTAQPDDQYDDLSAMHRTCRSQFTRYVMHVQKNIGGIMLGNAPGEPAREIVPRWRQREAVEWMGSYVFEPATWLYPRSICDKLNIKGWEEMIELRKSTLSYMLATGMMVNVNSNAYVSDEPYELSEYLQDVFAAVWKPLSGERQMDMLRRNLEQQYVEQISMSLVPTEKQETAQTTELRRSDAATILFAHLDCIEKYAEENVKKYSAGDVNYVHFNDILRKVKNIRNKW